jgi:hypothetical protein
MFWRQAPGILIPIFCGYGGTSAKNKQRANYPKNKDAQLPMVAAVALVLDWVFQTERFAPGSTRNDWGTSRPCLFPPLAVKSNPPAVRVVVDSIE